MLHMDVKDWKGNNIGNLFHTLRRRLFALNLIANCLRLLVDFHTLQGLFTKDVVWLFELSNTPMFLSPHIVTTFNIGWHGVPESKLSYMKSLLQKWIKGPKRSLKLASIEFGETVSISRCKTKVITEMKRGVRKEFTPAISSIRFI